MRAARRTRRFAAGALCALLCGAGLARAGAAQQPAAAEDDASRAKSELVLTERNRKGMRGDDPLTIVGREQGGNDVRSRTPALERSDKSAAMVDSAENYERTLAMYDCDTTFHRAPTTLGHSEPAPLMGAPTPPKPHKVHDQPVKGHVSGYWPWLMPIGLAALFALWARKQKIVVAPVRNPRRSRLV